MTDRKKPKCKTIEIPSAIHAQTVTSSIELLITSSFAQDWLDDALMEAKKENSLANKRREFIYAVCFAESYIFEWVRDNIFSDRLYDLIDFFTHRVTKNGIFFKGVKAKWKTTIEQLYQDGKIRTENFVDEKQNSVWKDFCDLLDLRNSIIHSNLSIPQRTSEAELIKNLRTKNDLDRRVVGWATGVVINLVKRFHEETRTKPFDWFNNVKKIVRLLEERGD